MNARSDAQESLRRIVASGGPSKSSNRPQLVDGQCAPLIPGPGTRGGESIQDGISIRLVYLDSLKVRVQEDHKDRIPVLTNIDSA